MNLKSVLESLRYRPGRPWRFLLLLAAWTVVVNIALLLIGCFADAGPSSGSTTSEGGSTSTGSTGSASSDSAAGSSTGSTGDPTGGSTTGAPGSTGEPEPPPYGPCSELGTCPGVQSCIDGGNDQTVCGAPCETVIDCPPPPPGQETACMEIDPVALSGECLLGCAGTWDDNNCPEGMFCHSNYNVCVFYAP